MHGTEYKSQQIWPFGAWTFLLLDATNVFAHLVDLVFLETVKFLTYVKLTRCFADERKNREA